MLYSCRSSLVIFVLAMLAGCSPRPVTVRPPVSTSLGYVVFQELGGINRAPVHIGLLIEKPLQEAAPEAIGVLPRAQCA